MEQGAYATLDRLGLQHPRVIELSEVEEIGSDSCVVLRQVGEKPFPNLMSPSEVLSRRAELSDACANGVLVQIEQYLPMLAGGCVVTMERSRYCEAAAGDLAGLTAMGWCSMRAIAAGGDIRREYTMQPLMLIEEDGCKVARPSDTLRVSAARGIAETVLQSTASVLPGLLLEFVVDESSGLWFTDAKQRKIPAEWITAESFSRCDEEVANGSSAVARLSHSRTAVLSRGCF